MTDLVRVNFVRANCRRLRRGFTKTELAEMATLHMNTVGKALAGCPISVGSAKKLAAALGLSYSFLVQVPDEVEHGVGVAL